MAVRLVECASCGAQVDVGEAAADTDYESRGLVEHASAMVRFYCPDCWGGGVG